jgi:MetJ family transcriptional regulator, methionine regulon repressor
MTAKRASSATKSSVDDHDLEDDLLDDEEQWVNPYIEHGKKAGATKKITVSIPLHVLKLLTDERTRRQIANLRHATISDLLVEAFLHAFTGQELPNDEQLKKS